MATLGEYIVQHTHLGPAGKNRDAVNMVFFDVAVSPAAKAVELRQLLERSSDRFPATVLFAGEEHSYIEIGAWLGSQELALRLMGLGVHLELWQLLSPRTMLGDFVTPELEREMAGTGLLSVQARVLPHT